MNEVSHARLRRMISFTLLCQKIAKSGQTRISKKIIRELEGYQLSLTAAISDESVGKIAANKLLILDELILYCAAVNEGNRDSAKYHLEKAVKIHEEGDRYMNAICDGKEVDDIGL